MATEQSQKRRFGIKQAKTDNAFLTLAPAAILEAIGAVTINFAAFEDALSRAVWYALARPEEGVRSYHLPITAELSFKQRVWMFCGVFRERYSAPEEWLGEISRRSFALEQQRNAIVHSV